MPASLDVLATYLPGVLRAALTAAGRGEVDPAVYDFEGAVLAVEIAGESGPAAQAGDLSPERAGELARRLNTRLGRFVELCGAYGGDVLEFTGAGLLAFWPGGSSPWGQLRAARRAACCGLSLAEARGTGEGAPEGLRVGIGVGHVRLLLVGGELGRWECAVSGSGLAAAIGARREAGPGEVVADGSAVVAWSRGAGAEARGRRLAGGALALDGLAGVVTVEPAATPLLSESVAAAARSFLPGAVRARLDAGLSGWLAELRRVAVLVVGLPGLDLSGEHGLSNAQAAVSAVQRCLYRYEGALDKSVGFEGGLALRCALGLPPLAHADDPVRALRAACAIAEVMAERGTICQIGISTGSVFCGTVGGGGRCEYTLVGGPVDLAERLMRAAGNGAIWCDGATFRRANRRSTTRAQRPRSGARSPRSVTSRSRGTRRPSWPSA